MASTERIRTGVVGLGLRGHAHSGVLSEYGHEIVAGADLSATARTDFAESFNADTYEEFEAMYDRESLDAVVVTPPNAIHAPAAIGALNHDYNVLIEKPLAESLESAEAILEAERQSEAFGMVGFTARFHPGVSLFKGLDEEGRFGALRHVETTWCRTRGIPGLGSWFTQSELSGGGAVIDIGVHIIDRAMYLLDFPDVVEVSAVTRADFGNRGDEYVNFWNKEPQPDGTFDVEDSASAFVRCADGKSIAVEVSWASNRVPNDVGTLVWGTEAGAEVSNEELRTFSVDDAGVDHVVESEHSGEAEYAATRAVGRIFTDSFGDGMDPDAPTIEEGVQVQRILEGIYRSNEKNRAVTIDS